MSSFWGPYFAGFGMGAAIVNMIYVFALAYGG